MPAPSWNSEMPSFAARPSQSDRRGHRVDLHEPPALRSPNTTRRPPSSRTMLVAFMSTWSAHPVQDRAVAGTDLDAPVPVRTRSPAYERQVGQGQFQDPLARDTVAAPSTTEIAQVRGLCARRARQSKEQGDEGGERREAGHRDLFHRGVGRPGLARAGWKSVAHPGASDSEISHLRELLATGASGARRTIQFGTLTVSYWTCPKSDEEL